MSDLVHFGVKGMKWGVRNSESSNAPNAGYSKSQRAYDRKNFTPSAPKRINKRMNKGQDLKTARKNEVNFRKKVNTAAAVGLAAAYYGPRVINFVQKVGPVAFRVAAYSVAKRAQTKRGQSAAANIFGLAAGIKYTKPSRSGVYNVSSL